MSWLIELQRWLYGGTAEGLKSAEHFSALPALLASAVLFGALHALMPGHGKSVLVSYHLGRSGRLLDGLLAPRGGGYRKMLNFSPQQPSLPCGWSVTERRVDMQTPATCPP